MSEKPAPAAGPSTAAMTGLGKARSASIQSCRPSMLRACHSGVFAIGTQALQIAARAEYALRSREDDAADLGVVFGGALRASTPAA